MLIAFSIFLLLHIGGGMNGKPDRYVMPFAAFLLFLVEIRLDVILVDNGSFGVVRLLLPITRLFIWR